MKEEGEILLMPALRNGGRACFKVKTISAACFVGFCMLALAGCMVGPDYHKPEAPVPQDWHGSTPGAPGQGSVATFQPIELVEWWKSFNDPVLTSLIERAIKANFDIRLAQSRIRQARASRGVVAAGLWPQINANASYQKSFSGGRSSSGSTATSQSSGSGSASGRGFGSSPIDLYQAGLDASWELDFFGGVRRNIEASEADIQAAVEDRRDVLVTLAGEVGTNYINLRGFQQQIDIANENLAAQKHVAEITRKRHEAGFVGGLDEANARSQVAATQSQIPVLESSAKAAIYSLSVLLGQQPAALDEELSSDKPIPTTPPEIPVGLPSDLVRRRPDIRRSEAQLHGATARIGVATADLFPKFSLTGSFGLQGTDISALGAISNRFWSIGPSATWPIFDAGRIRWNIEVQNALQEQALLTYEKTVVTALQDVETALVAYAKEQEHGKYLTEEVAQDRKAVDLSMTLYVAGKTDFLNVLTAERSLYSSEDALVQSTRNLANDLVALYKALGGGWEKEQ